MPPHHSPTLKASEKGKSSRQAEPQWHSNSPVGPGRRDECRSAQRTWGLSEGLTPWSRPGKSTAGGIWGAGLPERPGASGCLVPTAEEALRSQMDKLTHSETPSPATPCLLSGSIEAGMEIPTGAQRPPLPSPGQLHPLRCDRDSNRGSTHPGRARPFPAKTGRPVSLAGTGIYPEHRSACPAHHASASLWHC